jgi:hypothetical protein
MNVELRGVVDLEARPRVPDGINPFLVRTEGVFTGTEGQVVRIPGFYDGDGVWKIRFSPTSLGRWEYEVRAPLVDSDPIATGTLDCVPAVRSRPGMVGISGSHPLHFQHEDGSFHFMNAYECDWIWALDLGRPDMSRTEALLDQIASHRFNTILVNVYAHDTNWRSGTTSETDYGPPAMFAWLGTNDAPDHSQLNVEFFRHWDRLMALMEERSIVAHLFLKVYNKAVSWPQRRSAEDDLYFEYVVARYQAYWNVIWDFSKESFNEPDKAYLANRIALIRSRDAYGHLVTTHDDHQFACDPQFGNQIDFYTAQQHLDFYESAVNAQYRYRKPYFNSEFGYEHGPAGLDDYTYAVRQTPEEFVWRAWEIAMAGAYPAYYYTHTAWDVIDFSYDPPGAAGFQRLFEFFTSLHWWDLSPAPEIARSRTTRVLASSDRSEIVIFIHERERGIALVTERPDYEAYTGRWIDIFSDTTMEFTVDHIKSDGSKIDRILRVPFDSGVGVLHLSRRD